ncbi:MBL fold metallo-hydrolase [Devosia sp. A449]
MTDIEIFGAGVTRLICPMQRFASVNAWILGEPGDQGIVDTGMPGAATEALWQKAEAEGRLSGVSTLVCTHMHRDHTGQASALLARYGVPLFMSAPEHAHISTASSARADLRRASLQAFLKLVGVGTAARESVEPIDYSMLAPFPQAFTALDDGDVLRFGGKDWRVIIGGGHSSAGVCLAALDGSLFAAGDQILPGAGPHITVWSEMPEADPLGAYFAFLGRLSPLPDTMLVLPGHGAPFTGLAAHAARLRQTHEARLEEVLSGIKVAMSVMQIAEFAFSPRAARRFSDLLPGMTLSLANYLWHRNKLRRHLDDDGVLRFEKA